MFLQTSAACSPSWSPAEGITAVLVRLWSLAFPCTASACGVAYLLPVCVSEAVWPDLWAPDTRRFLDPTSACWNGYPMCWWWWIHLGGSPLMGVRCGPAHELQGNMHRRRCGERESALRKKKKQNALPGRFA